MYKKVALSKDLGYFRSEIVNDVFSISSCISADFFDYFNEWKHNGCWLFDSPGTMREIAAKNNIDLTDMTLFYYEVYENEFDDTSASWKSLQLDDSFTTAITPPKEKHLRGFDVATFSCGTSPECSPLSCNGLCDEIPVNEHCLFHSLEQAKNSLQSGSFVNSEPGPYRIFAVYTV